MYSILSKNHLFKYILKEYISNSQDNAYIKHRRVILRKNHPLKYSQLYIKSEWQVSTTTSLNDLATWATTGRWVCLCLCICTIASSSLRVCFSNQEETDWTTKIPPQKQESKELEVNWLFSQIFLRKIFTNLDKLIVFTNPVKEILHRS